ncbi:GTP cyclohydrolase FolE2 [Candidatus Persebacteraceae bacterium Df01]|jgi:GTP cyclohydrolase I|uniref:GTP cyclohydrolase FolE2 n=1 Tax=Candidatus Doriopsillibacter californiensis TaxID=2970740 RepID=A0ABT7QPN9_9GAMM|nr:GTP cyclohydrolase FolE2 [Candidatus Persebacteraceae bacterium Df01]
MNTKTANTKPVIKDIQGSDDSRAISINHVGICDIRLPMVLADGGSQTPTVGRWACYTNLPAAVRGTHMSRLVRVIHDAGATMNFSRFCAIPEAILEALPDADDCFLSLKFQGFINKAAPISKEHGYLDFEAAFYVWQRNGRLRRLLSAAVPVTSLCPCSKAISQYGAHNQRSRVECVLEAPDTTRLSDVVSLIEEAASCELYSILKRPDERHVTERAYDNPKFVEDMVRDLAVAVARLPEVSNYRVAAENFESIHNHSAYAMIQSPEFPTHILT